MDRDVKLSWGRPITTEQLLKRVVSDGMARLNAICEGGLTDRTSCKLERETRPRIRMGRQLRGATQDADVCRGLGDAGAGGVAFAGGSCATASWQNHEFASNNAFITHLGFGQVDSLSESR